MKTHPWLENHPHLIGERDENNTLYIASERLVLNGIDTVQLGAGRFDKFQNELKLSADGQPKSLWKLPDWLGRPDLSPSMSYHASPDRWTRDLKGNLLLQSVAKGQEFVTTGFDENAFGKWLENVVSQQPSLTNKQRRKTARS